MRYTKLLLIFFINTLIISLTLAIFEIELEGCKGWAQDLLRPWCNPVKNQAVQLFAQIGQHPYLTVYHLTMMTGLGILLYLEFLIFWQIGLIKKESFWFYSFKDQSFVPAALLAAVWLGVLVVEDFLWFLMNRHYPNSLADLMDGKIWWHTKWINFGSFKLPDFYLTTWPWILGLIFLARPKPFRLRQTS